ncbi:hypothetical protein PMAYCL1PPCAC_20616, partial [Pristionchus mayeri]
FRFAECRELFLISVGMVCAIICGMALPMLSFILGKIASLYILYKEPIGNTDFLNASLDYSFFLLGSGVICYAAAFIENLALSTASERITTRIKIVFITAVLGQDSNFLDATTAGAL